MTDSNNAHLVIMWVFGPEQAAQVDEIFASHGTWMTGHPKDGDEALLRYSISKGPELENPLDPASAPTGNTVVVLDEVYATPAGIPRHWQDAVANWPDLARVMEVSKNASVTTLHSGTIIQQLW